MLETEQVFLPAQKLSAFSDPHYHSQCGLSSQSQLDFQGPPFSGPNLTKNQLSFLPPVASKARSTLCHLWAQNQSCPRRVSMTW